MQDEFEPERNKNLKLLSHIAELRKRLIQVVIAFLLVVVIAYLYAGDIYQFLLQPLKQASTYNELNRRLIYTSLGEAFFTYLKLALCTALYICLPILLLQCYRFTAPGLYKKEKRIIYPLIIAVPTLFYLGAAVAYYFIIPFAWEFFLGFETLGSSEQITIQLEPKISEYLNLVIKLLFGFGIAFQLPVAIMGLTYFGAVKIDTLKSNRRYAVLIIVIAAAILTPPDPATQLLLAVVLYILYELSIVLATVLKKNHANT